MNSLAPKQMGIYQEIQNQTKADLTNQEIQMMKELNQQFELSTGNPQEIQQNLEKNLQKEELNLINYFEKMSKDVNDVVAQLQQADQLLKDLEQKAIEESNKIMNLFGKSEHIQNQNKILESRVNNQKKLTTAIGILVKGLDLSVQEKELMTKAPMFVEKNFPSIEQVLIKIAQFGQCQNKKYETLQAFSKQQEDVKNVLGQFTNIMKGYILDLAKQTSKAYYSTMSQNKQEIEVMTDITAFRSEMLPVKRILNESIKCNPTRAQEAFNDSIMEHTARAIKQFFSPLDESGSVNQMCIEQLKSFDIFAISWNFSKPIPLTLIQKFKQKSSMDKQIDFQLFLDWVAKLLEAMKGSVENNEQFWSKFFSFNEIKILPGSPKILKMMELSFETFGRLFKRILASCQESNPLSLVAVHTIAMYVSRESSDVNMNVSQFLKNQYSQVFIHTLTENAFACKESSMAELKKIFVQFSVPHRAKYFGVIQPTYLIYLTLEHVRCLVNFLIAHSDLQPEESQAQTQALIQKYCLPLFKIYQDMLQRITEANQMKKYKELIYYENYQFLAMNLEYINLNADTSYVFSPILNVLNVQNDACSKQYFFAQIQYLMPKFYEIFVQLGQGQFSSNLSNIKMSIKSLFANSSKILDKMLTRMKKHFQNSPESANRALKMVNEKILECYKAIEAQVIKQRDILSPSYDQLKQQIFLYETSLNQAQLQQH